MLQVTVSCDRVGAVHLANKMGWSRQRMFLTLRRAVHKTGRWCFTRVVRHLSSSTGIQQKKIRQRYVRLSLPKEHFPVAKVKIMDKGTPLMELHPRKTPTGISYRVGGRIEHRAGAFKQTMPKTGKTSIFKRRGKPRLPISLQIKSAIIENMEQKIDEVQVDTRRRLAMEIDRQVDVMLRQVRLGQRMRRRGEIGLTR